MRHGGKLLIDQLVVEGVRTIFEVPGESFLAALDGLYETPTIRTIVCRHEGAAAMMAEATGKLTGRPGVAFVTRGPGATNATAGVYIGHMDATPMVLFVGLPATRLAERSPFQDLDLEALFAPISKWTTIVRDPARIAEYVSRAFHVAMGDRPGPVVIGLPEDILSADSAATTLPPSDAATAAPSPRVMQEVMHRLFSAERPIIMVGGPRWTQRCQEIIETFAERFDIPVAASFRCQDYIDNRKPIYIGHSGFGTDKKLKAGLRAADLVLAIGAELGEISAGAYALIEQPDPKQTLIHVHPQAYWTGNVVRCDLAVLGSAEAFAEELTAAAPKSRSRKHPWSRFRADLRKAYEATLKPADVPGAVDMGQVVRTVSRLLPEGAVTTNGAGNYSQFVHRYFEFKGYRTGLAPICGTMGYGLPAAIAAKLEDPTRAVVAFAGDGCFQMTATELGTAVQYGLPIVIIIAKNGIYGTIRMHQERKYPGRVIGTTMTNPDFAALAQSFGALGETITRTEDFEGAFLRALAADRPTVLDLELDPEAITPTETLSAISDNSG